MVNVCKALEKRIWMAQLQVAFPLVEQERLEFITKWRQEIHDSLGRHNIVQLFEKITEPEDLKIGTLAFMVNNGKIAIRNEAYKERINFLREITIGLHTENSARLKNWLIFSTL